MTFSKSSTWGTEQERARALERLSGAEARRKSKEVRSISYDRECYWRGRSISSMEDHSGLTSARAEIQEGREGGIAGGCSMMSLIRSRELA